MNYVQSELDNCKAKSQDLNAKTKTQNTEMQADQNTAAFQELYELTQRKFLKQIARFCEMQQFAKKYPKLFCVDLVERKSVLAGEETEVPVTDETSELEDETKKVDVNTDTEQVIKFDVCIRPMCEFEEQWHMSPSYVIVSDVIPEWCSYLGNFPYSLVISWISKKIFIEF